MKYILSILLFWSLSPLSYAQTSDTSSTMKAPAPSSDWTGLVKAEISNKNLKRANEIGGAMTENQLRLAYKFNDKANLGFLLTAKYNLASEQEVQADQKVVNSDVAVAGFLVAPSFIGSDKVEIDARYYLPTSESSKNAKQNSMLRADFKLPYSLESGRVVTLNVSPRYFDFANADETLEVLSQARIGMGKTVIPYAALNHRVKMLGGQVATLTRKEEYLGPEVGLEYVPNKMVKLALLVAQERNTFNPTAKKADRTYSLFNGGETKYLLGAQIKM